MSEKITYYNLPKLLRLIADNVERNGLNADRPQGEWIDDDFVGQYRCSECDYYAIDEYDYCPNCGARMKGADDE